MNAKAAARPNADPDKPGLAARDAAMRLFHRVLTGRRSLDDEALALGDTTSLAPEDRALVRAIVTTTFRHFGTIRAALNDRADAGWPQDAGMLHPILVTAAAQILFMDAADHAAVDLAISLIRIDPRALRYAGLCNAVLRRMAREKADILQQMNERPLQDMPEWLHERWSRAYGDDAARKIARSFRQEPHVDLTPNPRMPSFDWAALPHIALPTGAMRLATSERIERLPGYEAGAWWVQDAAASLPAMLLATQPGERVLDLCAAPGGKTAQLAATGAAVTAVDRSGARLKRLRANLERLQLSAEIIEADGTALAADPFDSILIDAPCSATGTIRRHPELAWTRTLEDIARMTGLQRKLLDHAVTLLKPGGRLVYATCSLEPEEGERQIELLLNRSPQLARKPISAREIGEITDAISPVGDLRFLPHHLSLDLSGEDPLSGGADGFFAARLVLTPG